MTIQFKKGELETSLTVHMEGEMDGVPITPQHAPLDAVAATIDALRRFVHRTSERPEEAVLYVTEGSWVSGVGLPSDSAVTFAEQSILTTLPHDAEYAELVQELTRISKKSKGISKYTIRQNNIVRTSISPTKGATLLYEQPTWFETSLMIFGRIYNMGGKRPNIHVETEEYGNVKINLSEKQVQNLKLYKLYNIEVEGWQNWDDPSQIRDLEFVEAYEAGGDIPLETAIAIEGPKWAGVDIEEWLSEVRGRK